MEVEAPGDREGADKETDREGAKEAEPTLMGAAAKHRAPTDLWKTDSGPRNWRPACTGT